MRMTPKITRLSIITLVLSFQLFSATIIHLGHGAGRCSSGKGTIQLKADEVHPAWLNSVVETAVPMTQPCSDNFDTKIVDASNNYLDDDGGTLYFSRWEFYLADNATSQQFSVKPYYESDPAAWSQYIRLFSYVHQEVEY